MYHESAALTKERWGNDTKLVAAQREGPSTNGDRTAIYRQPSGHYRSATHQELGVSRISFRCLGNNRAHFAIGVENVKQHSSLFF
jgi:hypothetical protein